MTLTDIMISFLNMSAMAAVVIAVISLVRLPLSRAPKAITCGLWFVALFRLLCPVSFQSRLSLFSLSVKLQPKLMDDAAAAALTPVPAVPAASAAVPSAAVAAAPLPSPAPAADLPALSTVLMLLWAAGVAALAVYSAVSYVLLKRRIATATLTEDGLYESDRITSAFVCGLLRPRIYLPAGLSDPERALIVAHEKTHLSRRDYLVKPLWFAAVCLHWFNPLAWLAFYLVGRDMEMRCDEAVVRRLGDGVRADYSAALLSLSAPRAFLAGNPLAFGEGSVTARVKKVLSLKKPVTWIVLAAVAAAVTLTVALAANPKTVSNAPGENVPVAAPDGGSAAAEFLSYKTDYVGDNVKVGGILSLLEYPTGVVFDNFELQTAREPYGVTVRLSTDSAGQERCMDTESNLLFMRGAAILMSLVKNADTVDFKVVNTDDGKIHTFAERRSTIDAIYGPDICAYAASEASFDRFLKLLDAEPVTAAPPASSADSDQPAPEGAVSANVSYGLTKYGPDGVVLSISPLYGQDMQLAEDIITNAMVKSSAAPAVDLSALNEYYEITAAYADGTRREFFAFIDGGRACLQTGSQYTTVDDALFARLTAVMDAAQLSAEVEKNLEAIMSSPKTSSKPADYINAHRQEYEVILKTDGALNYMLSCFEKGEGDTLRGYIMLALCNDLLGVRSNLAGQNLSPSEWYSRLEIKAETVLPDYVYSGDDPVLKLVYATETAQYQGWGGGFTVVAVHLFGSYEEGDTLKAFVTTYAASYHLYGKSLEMYTGSVVPAAITYTKNADGTYALSSYTQAGDGANFAPSIRDFCTMPVSGAALPVLAEQILKHYGQYDDLAELQTSNLEELLRQNNITDVTVQKA